MRIDETIKHAAKVVDLAALADSIIDEGMVFTDAIYELSRPINHSLVKIEQRLQLIHRLAKLATKHAEDSQGTFQYERREMTAELEEMKQGQS